MFEIVVLPKPESGTSRERFGRITIGTFVERFGCYGSAAQISRMEATWRAKLQALVDGAGAVALVHDPRFAWVIYREDSDCFVHQIFSPTRKFGKLLPRSFPTAARPLSEWRTTVSDIHEFLQRKPGDVA